MVQSQARLGSTHRVVFAFAQNLTLLACRLNTLVNVGQRMIDNLVLTQHAKVFTPKHVQGLELRVRCSCELLSQITAC